MNKDNNFESIIKKEEYELNKRIALYNIIHGTFYKYIFKCIENDNINVLFYYNNKSKIQ